MDYVNVKLSHFQTLKRELTQIKEENESRRKHLQNEIWKAEAELEFIDQIVNTVEDQASEKRKILSLSDQIDGLKLQLREVSAKTFHNEDKKIRALEALINSYSPDEEDYN